MIDEAKFESLIRKKQKRVLDCSSLSEYHCEDFSSAAREALEDSSDPFALRWYWDTVAKLPLWYRVGFLLLFGRCERLFLFIQHSYLLAFLTLFHVIKEFIR